jgi:hypothetical protein
MRTVRNCFVALGACAVLIGTIAFVESAPAQGAADKYTLAVPNGLAFKDFRGYESWQLIAISQNEKLVAAILGNLVMIDAYNAGIPDNGEPFPDGAKMAKIHWLPEKSEHFPNTTIPGAQYDVDFMEKDSRRFADSGGWGYAMFKYDAASDTFTPGTLTDQPPQANDAKCGFSCHTLVKSRDYVFTKYGHR